MYRTSRMRAPLPAGSVSHRASILRAVRASWARSPNAVTATCACCSRTEHLQAYNKYYKYFSGHRRAAAIQRYLDALETADRTQPAEMQAKTERLYGKIQKMRQRLQGLQVIKAQLEAVPDRQISQTDPDARAMTTYSAKGTAMVGYNVQAAVETKNHLIVAHEVTNNGSDRAQLSPIALAARDAIGKRRLKAIADRGYYSGLSLKTCEDAGIAALVPKPMTSNARAEGRFDKTDFIYIAHADEYQCPAGQRAIHRFRREEAGLQISIYWSSDCPGCPMKAQCTTSNYRRIRRWEHEEVMDKVQQRLDQMPSAMTVRKRTIEHVFGTLKHWCVFRRM